MPAIFNRYTHKDVIDLIDAYPLALMVSDGPNGFAATPLPMLGDFDDAGALIRLVGHMACANPQADELRQNPRALFLFQGPQGYVSPRLVPDRSWAPTWNYALVRVMTEVSFKPEQNDAALRRLVARLEAGFPDAWSVEEMGERYARLSQHIIAFHARVIDVKATFKLGQDEKPAVFQSILNGLDNSALEHWMQRFAKN